jgi:hypothetical protein
MKASAIAMVALLAGGLIAPSHKVLARGAGGQRVGGAGRTRPSRAQGHTIDARAADEPRTGQC